ncbi:MAG: hypothetical protein CHACPFDD_04121 [Phycisphaerae bacterium]|nr:hypothetical protein [Phycisphaerae bacterium]
MNRMNRSETRRGAPTDPHRRRVVHRASRLVVLTSALTLLTARAAAASADCAEAAPSLAAAAASRADSPFEFGEFLREIRDLENPTAVALEADELFVCESYRHRVRVFGIDGVERRVLGRRGSGAGELLAPAGLAIDAAAGVVWVCDTGNHRVQSFSRRGEHIRTIGRRGRGNAEFESPRGMALFSGRVFVADTGNDRVQVFEPDGGFVTSFGRRGTGDGEFRRPCAVVGGPGDAVYVADAENNRIQVFDASGRFVRRWGEWGEFPGMLSAPSALSFRDDGLYVADTRNHRIQRFDAAGAPQHEWGTHALLPREGQGRVHYVDGLAISADGSLGVVGESFENRCQLYARRIPGQTPSYVRPPIGRMITSHFGERLDVDGNLMAIAEPETHIVNIFQLGGSEPILIHTIGRFGAKFGEFNVPTGVCVDAASRHVYVVDSANGRVQMFYLKPDAAAEPRFVPFMSRLVRSFDCDEIWRAAGRPAPGWPIQPGALARGDAGEHYVLDTRNATIFVFDADMRPVRTIGGYGDGAGEFRRPVELCVDHRRGRLLVVDADASRVVVLDREGRCLTQLGGPDAGDATLIAPFGVEVGTDGRAFVSDAGADAVLVFNPAGGFERRFGSRGLEVGQYYKPKGLARDSAGKLIVLDHGNHRGVICQPDGTVISMFGSRLFTAPARRLKR